MARNLTIMIVATFAGVVLGVFVVQWLDDREKPTIVIADPRPDATIVVSVEGAVATPGVYHLKGDARVQDALDAAGGSTNDADLARVNPAARLHDEERLVIPTVAPRSGEASVGGDDATPAASEVDASRPAPININTASAATLETLPRIGQVLAERIVAYREEHGPFRSVDELAQVDGISLAMVDELRSLIVV